MGDVTMSDNLSLSELDDRIAVLRENLRQLVEQAAAASGSQNEERIELPSKARRSTSWLRSAMHGQENSPAKAINRQAVAR
jgi:uncharacterized small protein (DUF1192 family)